MSKPIPYDDDNDDGGEERDMRKIAVYDEEALRLMQGWTGGTDDPLYAISSTGGWNYAWVFEAAIAKINSDLNRVRKIGRNKFQLGRGIFTKAEIDELRTIHDSLQDALNDPDSELVDEGGMREGRRGAAPVGRWTVEPGRHLYFDGRQAFRLDSEGNDVRDIPHVVVDGAAHLIAELFNQNGVTPDTIYERHMGHARRPRR